MNILRSQFDYGNHILLDLYECNNNQLYYSTDLLERIKFFVSESNATIMNYTHHVFSNNAYTLLILLAESHISFHSFPESNYIAIDIYTCGNRVLTTNVATLLINYFESKSPKITCTQRNNSNNIPLITYELGDYCSDENNEYRVLFKDCKVLCFEKTQYQLLTIIQNETYGKILLLDNMIMYIEKMGSYTNYMIQSIQPKLTDQANILIVGGGDLIIGNELNKYAKKNNIKLNITIVDIDKEVTEYMLKYYEIDTENLTVVFDCAYHYLLQNTCLYDAIILDITDPIGENATPSSILNTREFYEALHNSMKEGAMFVAQYGSAETFNKVVNYQPIFHDIFPCQQFHVAYTDEYFTDIVYLKGTKTSSK